MMGRVLHACREDEVKYLIVDIRCDETEVKLKAVSCASRVHRARIDVEEDWRKAMAPVLIPALE